MLVRSYRVSDTKQCAHLLEQVWDFDGFNDPEGGRAAALWYFAHHLLPSTHTFVFENEGEILGFLFATIPGVSECKERLDIQKLHSFIQVNWQKVTTANEREQFLHDWFYGGTWVEEALKEQSINEQESVWLQLFVVSPNAQGKGIGSGLLITFEKLVREIVHDRWLLLRTDTWCGWHFYERRDFKRLAECPVIELEPLEDGTQPAYFLYGKRIV